MFRKILFLTLLFALILTACGSASTSSGKLTFTDGLGREVKLDSPAQRVVSLAPSNTEILFALGAGSQLVGRDEISDYPEEAKSAHLSGNVILSVRVDEEGNVSDIRVSDGHPLLAEAAKAAVSEWKYSPTLLNGEPYPVSFTVTVTFSPNESGGTVEYKGRKVEPGKDSSGPQ